jgi:hypothetical protein
MSPPANYNCLFKLNIPATKVGSSYEFPSQLPEQLQSFIYPQQYQSTINTINKAFKTPLLCRILFKLCVICYLLALAGSVLSACRYSTKPAANYAWALTISAISSVFFLLCLVFLTSFIHGVKRCQLSVALQHENAYYCNAGDIQLIFDVASNWAKVKLDQLLITARVRESVHNRQLSKSDMTANIVQHQNINIKIGDYPNVVGPDRLPSPSAPPSNGSEYATPNSYATLKQPLLAKNNLPVCGSSYNPYNNSTYFIR